MLKQLYRRFWMWLMPAAETRDVREEEDRSSMAKLAKLFQDNEPPRGFSS